jgi:plasmid stability protein
MKNITVSVDEEVHHKARIRAAELGTSVSALVRDFLNELAEGDTDFQRRKRAQAQAFDSIRAFRAGTRLTRDDAHGRDALR